MVPNLILYLFSSKRYHIKMKNCRPLDGLSNAVHHLSLHCLVFEILSEGGDNPPPRENWTARGQNPPGIEIREAAVRRDSVLHDDSRHLKCVNRDVVGWQQLTPSSENNSESAAQMTHQRWWTAMLATVSGMAWLCEPEFCWRDDVIGGACLAFGCDARIAIWGTKSAISEPWIGEQSVARYILAAFIRHN